MSADKPKRDASEIRVGREIHRAVVSDYDTFVNWDARLARELPFFRDIFESVAATSVIDVGSGSARHAISFASWGMAVDAVDPDQSMLHTPPSGSPRRVASCGSCAVALAS